MKKIILFVFLVFIGSLYAQESVFSPDGWSFNLVSDFLYSPKSDYLTGGDHFSSITGPFDNFQNRERFHAVYLKHTPIGQNPVFQYANVSFDLGLELCIIDIAPMFSVSFMPVPFLILSAGGLFGTGWSLFGIDSVESLNKSTGQWAGLKPFVNNYYELWTSATLQFDTGAIFPGDWSHVIMSATYKVIYKGMTGMKKSDIWSWQGEPNMTNGLQYFQNYMIGYHFPKLVNFLGIITNVYGYYDKNAFGEEFHKYDGQFSKVDINPVIEFKFGREVIDLLVDFSSRRSFLENHSRMKEEIYLTKSGREWYLRSFIISWKHSF